MARLPTLNRPYDDMGQAKSTSSDNVYEIELATPESPNAANDLRRRSSVASHEIELALQVIDQQSNRNESSNGGDPNGEEGAGIYDIGSSKEPADLFSHEYVGITASYFGVGLLLGGGVSLLYPILVVKGGASSSFISASYSVIMIFWSYKIFFGFLSDCYPIRGYKRKPYMLIGWSICAFVLCALANEGNDVSPRNLVMMLSLCNFGYVWADTTADGFMVTLAHREPIEQRGKTQTFCYSMMTLGKIVANIVVLLGMSGPEMNCPGYEPSSDVNCTADVDILSRVDAELISTDNWCHEKCPRATLDWDLSIPTFSLSIVLVIATSVPLYLRLKEDKVQPEPSGEFLRTFWSQIQRRATWQLILYGVTSHITFGVNNAAKPNANYEWLDLSTTQQQIMLTFENVAWLIGLMLMRKYALNLSWRKMVMTGSLVVTLFNSMYFLIIFDICRNSWFYMVTDVSTSFMYTLNVFGMGLAMVEIAEPGFEAITYSLITASSNLVVPLSAVVSYQLLAFFPSLDEQSSIASDTPQVRKEFASLQMLVIFLNLSSLLALPLLPRQKKETRELVARGERSLSMGIYVICSLVAFLIYSSVTTFLTVVDHETYGCLKILGGEGCNEHESSIPALCLVLVILMYCYGTNFYLSYWPILRGQSIFSYRMFV